jgi:DNA-binding NarL/FixJ family response regulator
MTSVSQDLASAIGMAQNGRTASVNLLVRLIGPISKIIKVFCCGTISHTERAASQGSTNAEALLANAFGQKESARMNIAFDRKVVVGICETQPLMIEGLRSLLGQTGVYHLQDPTRTLEEAARQLVKEAPRVMILDKSLGVPSLMDWLSRSSDRSSTAAVVWGNVMTEAEALRFLKSGAKGIIRKTAPTDCVLACLEAVVNGGTWMEDALFHEQLRDERRAPTELTARERQVLELVEQGMRNKDIALQLGIRPGTVKIHLKHIFEKTGIRGRYGLALSGLKAKALTPLLHV